MTRFRLLIYTTGIVILSHFDGLAQYQQSSDSLLSALSLMEEDTIKVLAYQELFQVYNKEKQADKAKDIIKKGFELSERLNYKKGVAIYHLYNAEIYQEEGNFTEAIVHLNLYKQYHENKGYSFEVAHAYFELGKSFKSMGDFEKSLSHLYRSARLNEKVGNRNGLAKCYNSIGGIQSKMNRPEEAIQYYSKANMIFQELNDIKMYAMGLQNVGNVYARTADYIKAIDNYELALKLIEPLDLNYEKAIILGNLGGGYNGLKKHETALSYYLEAYELKKEFANKRSLAYTLTGIGTSYMLVNRNGLAEKTLDNALKLAKEVGSKDLVAQILELIAQANKNQNRFEEAYKHIIESNLWKDSVYNESSDQRISKLKVEYETAQKDQEIALLTKENEVQQANAKQQKTFKNALIGGILLLAIIAVLIFHTLRSRLRNQKLVAAKNEEIRTAQLNEELGTLEMKALRAQMNPHFLFNCMNSINRMIMAEENDKASKYLSKFSKLVRLMLENSEQPKVSLQDELQMLESYIQLEGIRFKNKLDYHIEVEKSIDKESTYLPPMVLQPFVENAIWHGLMHKKSRGHLEINIKETNDELRCTITDNGVGRERSLQLQTQNGYHKKSMGIKITADRLRLLTKEKIRKAIEIVDLKDKENRASGTQVHVSIPIS